MSAIPCLSYKRALEAEMEKQNHPASDLPNARIETIKENIETQNLSPTQLKDYCEKLFQFKTIKVMRFKSWSERRQYSKKKRQEKHLQRPTLPDGEPIKFSTINFTCNCSSRNQINNIPDTRWRRRLQRTEFEERMDNEP